MYKTLLTATLALGITGMTALSTKASTLIFADNFNQASLISSAMESTDSESKHL